jgi:hypothetical protein
MEMFKRFDCIASKKSPYLKMPLCLNSAILKLRNKEALYKTRSEPAMGNFFTVVAPLLARLRKLHQQSPDTMLRVSRARVAGAAAGLQLILSCACVHELAAFSSRLVLPVIACLPVSCALWAGPSSYLCRASARAGGRDLAKLCVLRALLHMPCTRWGLSSLPPLFGSSPVPPRRFPTHYFGY